MNDLMFSKKVVQSEVDELFKYLTKTTQYKNGRIAQYRNGKVVCCIFSTTTFINRDHTSNFSFGKMP